MINNELFLSANNLFKNEKYEEAYLHFSKALEYNNGRDKYFIIYHMAQCLFKMTSYDSAKTMYFKCFPYLNNKMITNALHAIYPYFTKDNLECIAKLSIDKNIPIFDLVDFVDILKSIICIKEIRNINNKNEVALLNYIHKKNSCDKSKLLIAFASRGDMKFQYMNLLKDCKCDILFLRDVSDAWYNKGLKFLTCDIDTTCVFLKNITYDYDETYCIGASSGGYAALLFGSLLKSKKIIAFSPQSLIPRIGFPDEELLKEIPNKYFDINKYINKDVNIHIYYSSGYLSDCKQAERLKIFPNIKLFKNNFGNTHYILPYLIKNNVFFDEINSIFM